MLVLLFSALSLGAPARDWPPASPASSIVDTAIARMGGADALRRIERVKLEMMTQWQRIAFEDRPYADQPSYEWHSELRDYTIPAWRNTRRFGTATAWREITDVVRDSVAIRRIAPAPTAPPVWTPLSVAYVDERREIFTFVPERVLLAARAAADLRALADTTIGGVAHARITATIDRFPATLFVRRSDGFLAMVRYRAAQINDFGLAPWGMMEVELWFSRWQKLPVAGTSGVAYPMQWDVRRVGRPYKRMTVLAATLGIPAAPDSFVISDSLRGAFAVAANKPMWDVPHDSARIIDGRFAAFGPVGPTGNAVKLGRRWIVLQPGTAPEKMERDAAWLARSDPGTQVGGALVSPANSPGFGGLVWLATKGLPIYVAPGATRSVDAILRDWGATSTATAIARGRWLRIDGDSMWVEPIELPDAPGSLVAYVPSLRWVYCTSAAAPLHLDLVMARAKERGWIVERVGSARSVVMPLR
jgi:hypothetical protein